MRFFSSLAERHRTARPLAVLCLSLLLATSAGATWSIVVIDRATNEVCVATATCLAGLNIQKYVPVIVVGRGAAAAQSAVDVTGVNRQFIRAAFEAGLTPDEILTGLSQTDSGHQNRQYGIVSLYDGPPVSFTGAGAGQARFGLTGQDGSLFYAIQGNVLAGEEVVIAAEAALLATQGDLSQRVMAAMQAAREMGGDGRCSCHPVNADSCGAPPPDFTHSAYCACIVVARMGDTDGTCNSLDGCANGAYFLSRRVTGSSNQTDPVIRLQRKVDWWRSGRLGLADHLLSEVHTGAGRLVADGVTGTEVMIRLVDIDGTPLDHGGQVVTVVDTGTGAALAGAVTDLGDGTHTFPVTATTNAGTSVFEISVEEGGEMALLWPPLTLQVDAPAPIHAGWDEVSSSAGMDVPFVLHPEGFSMKGTYRVLASAAGTTPGTPFGGDTIPLNEDRWLLWTLPGTASPLFTGSSGFLDGSGRGEAILRLEAGTLDSWIGGRVDFCAWFPGASEVFSDPVGFDVAP
jgi:uncharacterized Ntn-hydrolase superfamily protein